MGGIIAGGGGGVAGAVGAVIIIRVKVIKGVLHFMAMAVGICDGGWHVLALSHCIDSMNDSTQEISLYITKNCFNRSRT